MVIMMITIIGESIGNRVVMTTVVSTDSLAVQSVDSDTMSKSRLLNNEVNQHDCLFNICVNGTQSNATDVLNSGDMKSSDDTLIEYNWSIIGQQLIMLLVVKILLL